MKRIQFVLVLVGLAVIMAGGCTKSADGSKYNYASGNFTATLTAGLDQSYDASTRALEQMQLPVNAKAKDALGAKIVSKTYADKKLIIWLKRISDTTTGLTIEVGMIGEKQTSDEIYTKILDNLKK